MTFAGLPRGGERADVIAYLNSLSDNPAPLPKAAEAAGGAEAAVNAATATATARAGPVPRPFRFGNERARAGLIRSAGDGAACYER